MLVSHGRKVNMHTSMHDSTLDRMWHLYSYDAYGSTTYQFLYWKWHQCALVIFARHSSTSGVFGEKLRRKFLAVSHTPENEAPSCEIAVCCVHTMHGLYVSYQYAHKFWCVSVWPQCTRGRCRRSVRCAIVAVKAWKQVISMGDTIFVLLASMLGE